VSDPLFEFGSGPAFERLKELSKRAEVLPPESRELVEEIIEAYSVSVEELQVAAEELNQQNAELLAAREEIEAQHRRYREMFEFAPDGYLVTSPTGIIQEVNQAAVELLGFSRPYLVDKPLVLYVTPDERDRFHLRLDRLIESDGKKTADVEWEMRFKAGEEQEFPAALTVAPMRDPEGELTGLRWLLRDISESKRAEERERLLAQTREQHQLAQKANRLLQALIETMPVGAVISDAEGVFLLTNTAGREILGDRIVGSVQTAERPYSAYFPDGSPFPIDKTPLAIALKEKRVVRDVEVLIRRTDGGERNLLASAAPILDEAGELLSGISVFQDITERKKSRTALHRNSERLEALREIDQFILTAESEEEIGKAVLSRMPQLLECLFANLTVFDPQAGEFSVLASYPQDKPAQFEPLYDYLADAPILAELSRGDMHIEDDIQSLHSLKGIEALQRIGARTLVNIPILVDEDLIGTLNLGMEGPGPLNPEQAILTGKLASLIAIGFRQVRLHEQLQRHATRLERTVTRRTGALRVSEERFRIILDAAVFGIALLDTKGHIVQSNPALQNMTGYDQDELQGMTFSAYSHPNDTDADLDLYQALASGETGHYQVEKRFVRKDGQVRWSELTVSRVKQTKRDKPWLAVAIMEDITEKKRIQETLFRTERLTLAGRMGASLAHEINNPIQAVIGCLGLAEEILKGDNEARRYLDIAMDELERTANIVAQLRDLGREPAPGSKAPTDMNAFIERILVLTRKRCQNQGVEVDWQPAESLPPVRISAEHIQQVFLNIVLNALNAMEAKEGNRKMIISSKHTSQPEGVTVTVRDTGVGISAEMLAQIFEPFHSSRPDGLGLGLYISKNIVEEHGGKIDVKSVPGDGATFTVWLPV